MPAFLLPALVVARRLAVVSAVALSLSACGAGDVQLNGKVFDAIGGLVGSGGVDGRVAEHGHLVGVVFRIGSLGAGGVSPLWDEWQ